MLAELRRRSRDPARCLREPGGYAREAHRPVRGVERLEHTDGVEMWIVEQRAGWVQWRGRDPLFILVLSTIMLPYQVTMIPLYVIFNKIGWVNTLRPLIIPAFLGNPFFIFLLRQFFSGIPKDLSDSARIDGCTELRILGAIILPLARPALMVVALFQFLNSWNAFLGPLIYLNEERLFMVSLGLALMRSAYGLSRFSLIMAATSLFVIPVIILFFFAQRTFIQGITFTGMKR